MSQTLFFIPTYNWANSLAVLAGVFIGVVSMVLVLWELVLFYKMGVEFKGLIFLNCSRRLNSARIGLDVHNIADGPLFKINWYSGVVVGRAITQCKSWGSLPKVGVWV